MDEKKKTYLFDNPANVKRVIYAMAAIAVISIVGELFISRRVEHPWEAMSGFYGIYGFVAFVVLVLSAKQLRKILMRKDDYYDDQ